MEKLEYWIGTIDEKLKPLPELKMKVDELVAWKNRCNGAIKLIALMLASVGALVGLLSFAGCSSIGNQPCSAERDIISLGHADYDHDPVVAVWSADGLCSGTFIDRCTVLTAAHCVTHDSVAIDVDGIRQYDPSAIINHDQLDLALLHTAISPNVGFTRIRDSPPVAGEHIDLIGFGIRADEAEDSQNLPRKRIGENIISAVTESLFALHGLTGDTACPGDSGGPSLSRGEIVGVHKSMHGSCGQLSIDTRVDIARKWIDENRK